MGGVSALGAVADFVPVAAPATSADDWLIEAVADSRKQAQLLADLAYEAWDSEPSTERYGSYRAAQDRADALAADLAQLVRVLRPRTEAGA